MQTFRGIKKNFFLDTINNTVLIIFVHCLKNKIKNTLVEHFMHTNKINF